MRVQVNVPQDRLSLELFGKPIYDGVCDPKISLVQVQDSTATFESLIADFATDRVMEGLVASLEATYGAAEYGLATFADKPAPIHGYGRRWGMWREEFDHTKWVGDSCYNALLNLQSLDTESSIWDAVEISGGKDFPENQLDAFGKAAVDSFFWETAFDTGRYARVAMLITDDFPHKGNNEPDIGVWGFDSSYRGTQKYYNTRFGSWYENKYEFRLIDDMASARLQWPLGKNGKTITVQGNDAYRSFIICHDTEGMEDKDLRKKTLKSLQEA
ncbi:MAG: uncharacterized protein KVP18_005207, partial [Porospora cf. gigantea A]|uniref:uncharacterized protein n=1 Tax=Porospora cf. gigantea A TaxID=2853593 RepID=UPI00355AB513